MAPMTDHQRKVYDTLAGLGVKHPTVRSLTDTLESRKHRTERWSDDEVRGVLERLQAEGLVSQYTDEGGRERYCVAGTEPPAS